MEAFLFIPLGLLGLNLLVVVHELGHFWAARLVGVEVEAFAVGWGKILWKWKPGTTEYRFCLFPLGGYCKMKGDKYLIQAIEGGALEGKPVALEPEPGSFHAASPWRRILISLAGPVFNLVLTVVLFSLLQMTGVPVRSVDPRVIVLDSADYPGQSFPAQEAGLKSGDWIKSVNGKSIQSFTDLQRTISEAGEARLELKVERAGTPITIALTPRWIAEEKRTMIGIAEWQSPRIAKVDATGTGAITGLMAGDRITAVNAKPISTTNELYRELKGRNSLTKLTIDRSGTSVELDWVPVYRNGFPNLGVEFAYQTFPPAGKSLPLALWDGIQMTSTAIAQTTSGLIQLFTGRTSASESLSGPLKISYIVGETTSQSFADDPWIGVSRVVTILAYLSLALFYMNLLPIPALDGGSIVLHTVELVRRKPVSIRFFLRYQQVGGAFIIVLILFTLMNDTSFLFGPK